MTSDQLRHEKNILKLYKWLTRNTQGYALKLKMKMEMARDHHLLRIKYIIKKSNPAVLKSLKEIAPLALLIQTIIL